MLYLDCMQPKHTYEWRRERLPSTSLRGLHSIACKLIIAQNLKVDDWDAIEVYA